MGVNIKSFFLKDKQKNILLTEIFETTFSKKEKENRFFTVLLHSFKHFFQLMSVRLSTFEGTHPFSDRQSKHVLRLP